MNHDPQMDLIRLQPAPPPRDAAAKLIDQLAPQAPIRTNWQNDGRAFQKELEMTAGGYQSRRIATLRKVDPPTRIVGGRESRRVIFLANPFPDFVGAWTARSGRAIFVEAKSTKTHLLAFNGDNGLTAAQWGALKTWRHCSAAVALVWQWNGRVALFTAEMLLEAEARAAKSIAHENGLPVLAGPGSIIWDFLAVLERTLWPG